MPRKPTHNVRLIPSTPGETWPFVGAAWENRDGSLSIILDEDLPKGSKVQIRRRKAPSVEAAS